MNRVISSLQARCTAGSQVLQAEKNIWRLVIPAGRKGIYRLAQLDDYTGLPRRKFRWRPPVELSLRARASHAEIPGTWGFGFWNDPFSFSLGIGGASRRFPALPNAAWFFYAAELNYLSFRDNLSAQGFLAAVFRSRSFPGFLLGMISPVAVLVLIRPISKLIRKIAGQIIQQDAALLTVDPTSWHSYQLQWSVSRTLFWVDEQVVLDTAVSPQGPMGLVLWIDNQYAAWHPDGKLNFGTSANYEPAWIELSDLVISDDPS